MAWDNTNIEIYGLVTFFQWYDLSYQTIKEESKIRKEQRETTKTARKQQNGNKYMCAQSD